jgi:hypothetical protein
VAHKKRPQHWSGMGSLPTAQGNFAGIERRNRNAILCNLFLNMLGQKGPSALANWGLWWCRSYIRTDEPDNHQPLNRFLISGLLCFREWLRPVSKSRGVAQATARGYIGTMIPAAAPLALRPTVIAGEKSPDDYQVIWNGFSIGRIMKQTGMPQGRPDWSWSVSFPGRTQLTPHRGHAAGLTECKRLFKMVWLSIHRTLGEADMEARHNQEITKDRPWNRHDAT